MSVWFSFSLLQRLCSKGIILLTLYLKHTKQNDVRSIECRTIEGSSNTKHSFTCFLLSFSCLMSFCFYSLIPTKSNFSTLNCHLSITVKNKQSKILKLFLDLSPCYFWMIMLTPGHRGLNYIWINQNPLSNVV